MKVLTVSIVRDGMPYLNRYLAQIASLKAALQTQGDELISYILEGDSVDGSDKYLGEKFRNHEIDWLQYYYHKGEKFGSVDNPTRWKNISKCWNYAFDDIRKWNIKHDALIYIEADLIWTPDTMLKLLSHLKDVPAVAPMCFRDTIFYDTWGHRADGSHFTNGYPYHSALSYLSSDSSALVKLDSAGSCKVMRSEVSNVCRFSEIDAMLGHDIYAKGFSLWLDPSLKVEHP